MAVRIEQQNVVLTTLNTARFGSLRMKFYQPHPRQEIYVALQDRPVKLATGKNGKQSDFVTRGGIFLSYRSGQKGQQGQQDQQEKKFQYHPAGIVGALRKMQTMLAQYDREEDLLHSVDLAVKDSATELHFWNYLDESKRRELDVFLVKIGAQLTPHPERRYDEQKEHAAQRLCHGVKDATARNNPTATGARLRGAVSDLDKRRAKIKLIRPYLPMRAEVLQSEQERILRAAGDLLLLLRSTRCATVFTGNLADEQYKQQSERLLLSLTDRLPNTQYLSNPFLQTFLSVEKQIPQLATALRQHELGTTRALIGTLISKLELFDYLGIASQLNFLLTTRGNQIMQNPEAQAECLARIKASGAKLRQNKLGMANSLRIRFSEAYDFLSTGALKQARMSLQQVELVFC